MNGDEACKSLLHRLTGKLGEMVDCLSSPRPQLSLLVRGMASRHDHLHIALDAWTGCYRVVATLALYELRICIHPIILFMPLITSLTVPITYGR